MLNLILREMGGMPALSSRSLLDQLDQTLTPAWSTWAPRPAGTWPQFDVTQTDDAVIVTNPEVSSVRDSDRIIGLLDSRTLKAERGESVNKHILITRFDAARAARGEMLNIDDVLEILSTPLLGIIPENQGVLRASNVGSPVTLSEPSNAAARAYMDAAKRLEGEDLPVVLPFQRQGFLDRLFGRRAA